MYGVSAQGEATREKDAICPMTIAVAALTHLGLTAPYLALISEPEPSATDRVPPAHGYHGTVLYIWSTVLSSVSMHLRAFDNLAFSSTAL